MKSLISMGIVIFALSFCNLSEKLKSLPGSSTGSNSTTNSTGPPSKESGEAVEKPELNAAQRLILAGGAEADWSVQGMIWTVPKGWKKMTVAKNAFTYGSSDFAFLIGTISDLPASVPPDVSLKGTYSSSLEQLKTGKYETVRYLEIDGIKGVEWIEAMPETKDSPRRHQWIGYRNYQGQSQMLNIMLSTKGTNFDKHRDDFSAVMYSMRISK